MDIEIDDRVFDSILSQNCFLILFDSFLILIFFVSCLTFCFNFCFCSIVRLPLQFSISFYVFLSLCFYLFSVLFVSIILLFPFNSFILLCLFYLFSYCLSVLFYLLILSFFLNISIILLIFRPWQKPVPGGLWRRPQPGARFWLFLVIFYDVL